MTSACIIAAARSGSGKTLVTIGILRALRRRGLAVSSFKTGPDYLDSGFLAAASGRPALNLDSWAMRLPTLAALVGAVAEGADVTIGEGVMGLFDGAADGTGSTADLSALLALPVILVLDATGTGASIAATAAGFVRFREDVDIAGIILNRVAGERHAAILTRAIDAHLSTPVLGWLPRDPALLLPSRHLGLVQAGEQPDLDDRIERAADLVARQLDLDRLLRICRAPGLQGGAARAQPMAPFGQRIAVARDEAFAFTYPATLAGWRSAGACLSFFSPLADQPPDAAADAVFLPGGYPELHAGSLAAATHLKRGLAAAAARGAAIWGECGGYMLLGEALIDSTGTSHAMAGLLPVVTSIARPRLQLGYRLAVSRAAGPLGPAGLAWRGHEHHHASEVERRGPSLLALRGAGGETLPDAGSVNGRVGGSFIHLIDREG